MDYIKYDRYCKRLIECYKKIDAECYYRSEVCEKYESVMETENRLGVVLPKQLKSFFMLYSGAIEYRAFFPRGYHHALPSNLRNLFAGEFVLSLKEVENSENCRRGWIENVYTDKDNPYDKVWYGKLGIFYVGNGDVIALDIDALPDNPPVVYLSHDGDEDHGVILGKDFESFMLNLIMVGGCGMEVWQMTPFINDKNIGIDPFCENAIEFRKLIGFELD